MAGELALMLAGLAETQRRVAGAQLPGVVHEVRGDKLRVQWARDPAGNPVLSPWLDTSDHRGGARERRFYQVGQNVTIATVNGEVNGAATVSADAPNEKFPAPDHADDAGAEAETYQLGELRITKKGDLYEVRFGRDGATKLRIDQDGNITVKGVKLFVDAPLAEFAGDVRADGEMTAKASSGPVNLSTHTHRNVQTGGGISGPPVPGT